MIFKQINNDNADDYIDIIKLKIYTSLKNKNWNTKIFSKSWII